MPLTVPTRHNIKLGQVMARVTGREKVVFGKVLFGRMKGGEVADRGIGRFINTLQVEFQPIPDPIKSTDAKREIEAFENAELKKILYPLNIKDNEHDLI